MDKQLILKPRLSEKSFAQSQALNTYVFDVPAGTNKHEVARAVSAQFEVTVLDVNILNLKGKAKRTISRSGRSQVRGVQSDVRKAYVKLKQGDSIAVFGTDEAEASAEEAKKADKKEAKKPAKAKKEEKK